MESPVGEKREMLADYKANGHIAAEIAANIPQSTDVVIIAHSPT
jgi:hypothetical protein